PAEWLSVPVGDSTFHLGRLKYGGRINPLKLQKALAALGRDDDLTRLLTQVAASASFVFSIEPCREDPDFYDLTVRDHNNYLAGENGLVVIHNSGVNLSTLRSSRERLAAGGKSSGPISFMKGLDASAGSIKSGGSTRRAACMRVLDIDHPDVKEFIDCKKDAEEKAHALIDAGYSGAFNVPGGAYDTVPFQNANHSVRVTDEFMQAVEAGADWQTKYRLTGKPADTYKARDLMHGIAEGTHVCGDPGMQYDTTINDWHTCSNTDRIYASNPCCVTADTLIAVADGRNAVPIKELVGTEVPVYAHDHATGRTTISRMWNVGIKRESAPVYRVTLDDGSTFRATDDHLIMLRDGSYRMVRDLRSGDSLMPFHSKVLTPEKTRTKRRYYWTGRSWHPQYRAVWEYFHGAQPAGFHIHHKDFDALNDTIENLALLIAEDHQALHGEKMRGDNNPARRLMSDEWRQNIGEAVRGTRNGNYGRTHSEETRRIMREKSARRWANAEERARSGAVIKAALARAKAEGRPIGRPAGERYERCCPICRGNFTTRRVEQIFCSDTCRCSPLGRQMSGEKTWAQNRGRALSAEHRTKLSVSVSAASDPETKRCAAQTGHRNTVLKVARLLLDNNIIPSLDDWDELRGQARSLGAGGVPMAATARRHFTDDAALREQAELYNHKIASVEFCGHEDVYDGTVDTHHNFAILTSAEQSCAEGALNYSGIFIHNSEYMFLNSTACNLSSLNLMKFRKDDGAFDAESFEHAVRIMITGQEIVVGFAAYPTAKIEERSHVYRTLGLGYANLGALLMAAGLPYDSDAGRAYAGAVTALMTGRAYHQSAVIARDCGGPFAGFQENREPMLRVMRKHREHVDHINKRLIPSSLLDAARTAWDETLEAGQRFGYRNAQATVLAPTGTIGFLMDCDTTGIEPDIAIVKYKSLVGGGMMKIVNQTVPEALQRLGYTEGQIEAIVKFIDENDTVEGAPDLKPEHLPIFDCAFRPMNGTRSIHHMGHIKMMAAAQPFISGAISKTVNVPNDATPETIADTYLQAWKLGLKAVAIYRDGSKRTQPLSTSREAPAGEKTPGQAVPDGVPPQAVRHRLPDERASVTHKFSIGGHEGYLTVGLYPENGQPGEIFIRMSKEGSSISGLMDSFATAISLALQYGVPLGTLVDKFIHSRFEPSGFTGNKDIPMAKSVMDYIFRYLALRFLQKEERHNVGLLADQEDGEGYAATPASPKPSSPPSARAQDAKSGTLSNGTNGEGVHKSGASDNAHLADNTTAALTDHEREIYRMQSDAPPCPECGAITIRSGACYKCISCGTSLGCS
ncbi:MAG: HNH endonuclease, partial [Armatimonadetes bacterium]|nr:HNH endonuclease [Armatimonadota bacterium]